MKRPPIAIVGFAGVFPGADSVEKFWQNIIDKKSRAIEIPESRLIAPMDSLYHPTPMPDKALSKRACLITDFAFDPSGFNIDSSLLSELDPLYHLVLHAGREAFAGCHTYNLNLQNVGVSLAAIALPTDGSSAITREIFAGKNINIRREKALAAKVTSLPAAILAKALRLGCGTHTLDAACASSLYAVKIACDALWSNQADAMLAGGVSRPDCLYTQIGFSQLRALSRSGICSPFDEKADGLVVGEGAGILVLKRLEDAIRDKDTIHALICGIGLSNDMRGNLLAPETRGQVRAMQLAYQSADWQPSDVDLIECHGTGTPAGDMTEAQSLRTLWGESSWSEGQCAIGSVKSMIGHLLTGAGAAGMIKILLALKHKILPPSLNFTKAAPNSPLHHSPFRVQIEPEEWRKRNADTPRRAAVSAFGFGGINAHILFEEFDANIPLLRGARGVLKSDISKSEDIAIVGMSAAFGKIKSLREFQEAIFNGQSAICELPQERWKGANAAAVHGAYMDDMSLYVGEFNVPPNEIPDILPQQLLMLKLAAEAMKDANLPLREERPRMGAIIGIEFDMEACNFHLRWSQYDQPEKRGVPLTATRTVGALGGIVASRVAREFRLGGPCFTVSGEESAGVTALEIAVKSLQNNEMDAVLVGAVDLSGDIRNIAIHRQLRKFSNSDTVRPFDLSADGTLPGDGSAAVILKRLSQAIADRDKIYSVIKGIGKASGEDMKRTYSLSFRRAFENADVLPESISLIEAHGSGDPDEDHIEAEALHDLFADREDACALGSVKTTIGHTGAVSGLASLVKAALCLYHNITPPMKNSSKSILQSNIFHIPEYPQYAEHKNACVAAMTADGNCCHVVLEPVPNLSFQSPEINFRAENSSLLKQASASSRAIYRSELKRPLGLSQFGLFMISGNTQDELLAKLNLLDAFVFESSQPLEAVARDWYRSRKYLPEDRYALCIVASEISQLHKWIEEAKQAVSGNCPKKIIGSSGIAYSPNPIHGEIAFVFPGSGNHYDGMNRGIRVQFPEILRPISLAFSDSSLFAKQIFHGIIMSNIMKHFGIKPDAVIGYSLGESAGLFALNAWTDREEMFRRMQNTDLFTTQLAGECLSLRKAWNIPQNIDFVWAAAVLNRPAEMVREIIAKYPYVRLLIVNTPDECVIGGDKSQIEQIAKSLNCEAFYLEGIVTVHCDAAAPAAEPYRNLHVFPVTPPKDVRFYSCALGKVHDLTSESAADSILKQALYGFDFPKTIHQAYQDGVRIFLEMGPQASCTRMISRILQDKPHLAVAADSRGEDDFLSILKFLAALIAERVPVDLDKLYGNEAYPRENSPLERGKGCVTVKIGGILSESGFSGLKDCHDFSSPLISESCESLSDFQENNVVSEKADDMNNVEVGSFPISDDMTLFMQGIEATAKAHRDFLDFSSELMENFGKAFEIQAKLIEQMMHTSAPSQETRTDIAYDRDMCMEFAIGSIAKVLGPQFAVVDTYKARVRLPDEPLMLVDRIISVEGEKGSLGSGRVVTEHDVLPGAWYLDGNRAPVCISVEAGQADLFLCSYLGIDLKVKGQRTYRLLDAKVRFHRGLPQPGDVIRYEIEIEKFVRQGETYLFFFHFEGFIGDEHLISMREGCAGFFTEEEVKNSGGIILTEEEKKPIPGKKDFTQLVPFSAESYDDAAIEALRNGDLETAFGSAFANVRIAEWLKLPGGLMRLIHRVLLIDPNGGRYGIGLIRAEADIHPDDWFLTCHFVDDMVMPGTLMYECCAHTLRVFLQRMGWVTDKPGVCYEPIIGNESVLKCRGPVTQATRHVIYEVQLKEIGYNPEPYAIADAQMYADGHHIVMFKDMGMKMTGITREEIESFWRPMSEDMGYSSSPILYSYERILAFAIGKPSEAFGEPYKVFDEERRIARLPGPPYAFMHRVTKTEPDPWILKPGGWIEAEYDLTPEEWYFKADRSGVMPFCVLLEIALQPCGWLAAYLGSALRSKIDLKFRNLGGKAILHQNILPETQTLTMHARMTQVSEAGGMIIENFDMQVLRNGKILYEGDTYFGFFSKEALAQQVGIQGAKEKAYQPTQDELSRAISVNFDDESPLFPEDTNFSPASSLAMPAKALRMIDKIEIYVPDGGPHGLGFIRGIKMVDPDEWFFKAHFYQDPVCPGSLGIESFLQLMKFAALNRWKKLAHTHRFEMLTGKQHNWIYRGQIIQKNKRVEVDAVITEIREGENPEIYASGYLKVDGLFIYQMEDFGLRLVRI